MDRIQTSWELFKKSLEVMFRNKTLLAFPILISLLSAFLAALFLVPVAHQRTGHGYLTAEHWRAVGSGFFDAGAQSNDAPAATTGGITRRSHRAGGLRGVKPLAVACFAAAYFSTMFLATFLNVAFYREILNALRGQPVSLGEGIRFAASKWKIIVMWTLFAGIIGYIIKALEERLDYVGQWIMGLLGAVWSVACVFVIPVIVVEEESANPLVVLRKSASTVTQTWGESLAGYVGVSLGGFVMLFGSLLWLGAGIALAIAFKSVVLGVCVVLSWLVAVSVLSYLFGVASQIFRCALFLYATEGALPAPYSNDMMSLAWKTK